MSEERDPLGGTNPPSEEDAYEEEYLDETPEGEGAEEPPEPEGDAEPEGEAAQPTTQQRRPGRRERQQAEIRELKERSDRAERELRELRQRQEAPPRQDPQEQARRDEQEFQAALAQVPFEQQGVFAGRWWADRHAQRQAQQFQQMQLAGDLRADKASWDTTTRLDPLARKYAARVEEVFESELRAGRPQTRQIIYEWVVGKDTVAQAGRRTTQQRQAGERRLQQQRTRPGGTRSDGSPPTRRPEPDSIEAAYERIRGRQLW